MRTDLSTPCLLHHVPKMYKTGASFTFAFRKRIAKALSKIVTKDFKLIFKQFRKFLGKSHLCSNYKKLEVVESYKPVSDKFD